MKLEGITTAIIIGLLSKTEFKNREATEGSSIIMERAKTTPGAGLPSVAKDLPAAPTTNGPTVPVQQPATPAPQPAKDGK